MSNISNITAEIAATAARLVVEEGLEYGPAKRRAVKQLGLNARTELPGNDVVEDAVFDYVAVFCADTQPAELLALRRLALRWMQRLAEFRPHLGGAVWRGTATRLSDIHLQLFCDDPKSAEIALINLNLPYEVGSVPSPRGDTVDRLSMTIDSRELGEPIGLHLTILDLDDLRGALKPDARGRTERGDVAALERLLEGQAPADDAPGVPGVPGVPGAQP